MSKPIATNLDSVGQLQIRMFHETIHDAVRELARQYVSKDGKEHGTKAFAKRLFPLKTDDQAYMRLTNCTNQNTRDEFNGEEWMAIIQIGHEQNKHFVAEMFCGATYQLTPVDPDQIEKRVKRARRLALLEELKRLEADE